MNALKCIRCKKLFRGRISFKGDQYNIYDCVKFGRSITLDVLFNPRGKILEKVWSCGEGLTECVACGAATSESQGKLDIPICPDCRETWLRWFDVQPGIRIIAPRGRVISSLWFDKFKEFAESRRRCRVCGCTWENGCRPPRGPCSWVDWNLCSACEDVDAYGDHVPIFNPDEQ